MTRARNLADFNTLNIDPSSLDDNGTIPSALLAGVGGGENTPYFLAYRTGNQTGLINNGWREIICNGQTIDSDTAYNPTTGRFTPQEAGYYHVQFVGSARDFTTAGSLPVQQIMYGIKKNATGDPISVNFIDLSETHVQKFTSTVSTIVYLNGSSDFVSPYVYVVGGANQTYAIHGESQYTNFSGYKLIH